MLLLKSLIYRIYSIFLTFFVVLLITGDANLSAIISGWVALAKIISYWVFEVLWEKINKL